MTSGDKDERLNRVHFRFSTPGRRDGSRLPATLDLPCDVVTVSVTGPITSLGR